MEQQPMSDIPFDDLLAHVLTLSPLEKVRLVEKVMNTLEQDLSEVEKTPKRSLLGLWEDLNIDISEEDIAEARREMWGNFPQEDI
jgi:hypothetical protein